jgi:hypothetical protein
MFEIVVKGEAFTEYQNIKELDNISCEDVFSDYFDEAHNGLLYQQPLIDKGVDGGYMFFKYENNKLWTITTYESPEELTDDELEILMTYTQGQWSDGIGEGFEQYPCTEDNEGNEVYVSPWFKDQQIFINQYRL